MAIIKGSDFVDQCCKAEDLALIGQINLIKEMCRLAAFKNIEIRTELNGAELIAKPGDGLNDVVERAILDNS